MQTRSKERTGAGGSFNRGTQSGNPKRSGHYLTVRRQRKSGQPELRPARDYLDHDCLCSTRSVFPLTGVL
jgi:hypothetical protein